MIEPTDEMVRAFGKVWRERYQFGAATQLDATRDGLAAVLTIVERDYVIGPPRVTPIDPDAPVHLVGGGSTTLCCGRTMFELPHSHRCTAREDLRTCRGPWS